MTQHGIRIGQIVQFPVGSELSKPAEVIEFRTFGSLEMAKVRYLHKEREKWVDVDSLVPLR